MKKLFRILFNCCFILVFCLFVITYVLQKAEVSGDSMCPTLEDRDVVLVDKLSYRFRKPERFDILVFQYRYRDDSFYMKRIIGLPGETVQIKDGKIWVEGEVLDEKYDFELIEDGRRAENPVLLGENEYFVLGDNRNHSSDSRDSDIGNVKLEQAVGKVMFRIWPVIRTGVR